MISASDYSMLEPTTPPTTPLSIAIERACLEEVRAPKPGNVHPGASFSDLCCRHFEESANAAAPWLASAVDLGVGPAIYHAIRATRQVVHSNTNLGIALLIAPLAAVPLETSLEVGIGEVLEGLSRRDAEAVYRAIALAVPGGMGEVVEGDIQQGPTGTLREMMALAAGRDTIAREYTLGFQIVLGEGLPLLRQIRNDNPDWPANAVIVALYLELLARYPDTLIARKCGVAVANDVSAQARRLVDDRNLIHTGWPLTDDTHPLTQFDRALRKAGNRLNPGTTADLIAAVLFAHYRDEFAATSCEQVGD